MHDFTIGVDKKQLYSLAIIYEECMLFLAKYLEHDHEYFENSCFMNFCMVSTIYYTVFWSVDYRCRFGHACAC